LVLALALMLAFLQGTFSSTRGPELEGATRRDEVFCGSSSCFLPPFCTTVSFSDDDCKKKGDKKRRRSLLQGFFLFFLLVLFVPSPLLFFSPQRPVIRPKVLAAVVVGSARNTKTIPWRLSRLSHFSRPFRLLSSPLLLSSPANATNANTNANANANTNSNTNTNERRKEGRKEERKEEEEHLPSVLNTRSAARSASSSNHSWERGGEMGRALLKTSSSLLITGRGPAEDFFFVYSQ